MKMHILILCTMLFSTMGFNVQERTISGKVISADDGKPIPGVNVLLKGTTMGAVTGADGNYSIAVPSSGGTLVFSFIGYQTREVKIGSSNTINVSLQGAPAELEEVVVTGRATRTENKSLGYAVKSASPSGQAYHDNQEPQWNTEEYDGINENIFHDALRNPLSTFSIDVDAASYSNMRRFINNGQRPPKDAIRIEELVNYFDYDYSDPKGDHPFNIITEISSAPWNTQHKLVHIGLQGKRIPTDNLPPSNLVFLIDVSGSMESPNKLPLLKSSFRMLANELRPQDHVAIVVYAGAAGLVLRPTSGENKSAIVDALDKLQAGGST
ncbi:MAG: von Willebrand factor type A domain-containing protein, partial [Cyclobacteriaceae bacterium]|nr:von Willebrand factor type A domain-containing protein [Cyclobacteriaceae bacterium]